MEQVAVKLSGRGRPRLRPLRLVVSKGYTGCRISNYLRRGGSCITTLKKRLKCCLPTISAL
jgi:hypothetical protein